MTELKDNVKKMKNYTHKVDYSLFSELDFPMDEKFNKYVILPGFCDVHVHFREPGFSYKESIKTGSRASARGGFTAVCTMPNLNPVPDCLENLKLQQDIIDRDALIDVYPYGAITVGEQGKKLVDMEAMACRVIAFSDDGKGVQSDAIMLEAMKNAKKLDKIIAAHCEDNTLLCGGYIHKGEYARLYGHRGISSASEYKQIERDLRLVEETGCKYHVCHISTKESVELIRDAKKRGLDVSCETGPHYLVMDDSDLEENGRFKMNPPLRSSEDRLALIEGIKDGTIDMIATDHAPHSIEEKSKGLEKSAFGVVGIETAFPVIYTKLVKPGIISMERLIELMSENPSKRFGINMENSFSIWKLEESFKVNPKEFISKGKATPFENWELYGRCVMTVCNDTIVYKNN